MSCGLPSGEETFDKGLRLVVMEDLLLAVGRGRGRKPTAGGNAGSVGTGGMSSGNWRLVVLFCPSISIDRRRITASIERSSRLLALGLTGRLGLGVTPLLARRAGCMRSDEWSSLRRTASGSGWVIVLLILAALIRACSSSAATSLGSAVGAVSFARGLEKFG
jgi:hypothetical protein